MLECHFISCSFPKKGHSDEENEDNLLTPSKTSLGLDENLRFAIADGATESSFSKEWSDLLVCGYHNYSFNLENLPETLREISKSWWSLIKKDELPWYAEQKAEKGAFATFLGLSVFRKNSSFEVTAVGDCAMFQIRNGMIYLMFPLISVDDFNNTPSLLASNEKFQIDLEEEVKYLKGTIEKGDIIILATDAIAAWIVEQKDRNEILTRRLIDDFFKNYNAPSFKKWLDKNRDSGKIKNDDVSLIMIKFE